MGSQLLQSLQAITRAHPTSRKRLVAPDINFGREYLATLARVTGGWIGWEATTLRVIAEDLAFVPLSQQGIRAGSDVEIGAIANRALDNAISGGRVSPRFALLQRSLGFRRALRDALLALRTGGVTADIVRASIAPGSPAHDLPAVLEEYEALLKGRSLTDSAGVFRAALDSFESEAQFILVGDLLLVPTLITRGLPGQLLRRLLVHGARPLASDTVMGTPSPSSMVGHLAGQSGISAVAASDVPLPLSSALAWVAAQDLPSINDPRLDNDAVHVDFFSAASPSEELREVCRRIAAEGHRWDQVEIVTTDVDAYGVALDALCQQLDVEATMLYGVPLARTRLGRALERWLAWLGDGLPSDTLRQALEAGELHSPNVDYPPTAIARGLRRLQIGWGRKRYDVALAGMNIDDMLADLKRRDEETDEELSARKLSRRRALEATASFLTTLLASTPHVTERGDNQSVASSCAILARAALAWLDMVPLHGQAEQQTAVRLRTRLEQLAEIVEDTTSFSNALAAFRDALADLRAWPLLTDARKLRNAAGGMLHLTDIAHAGATGRPRLFVVGLDASRTQSGNRQDPLLPDAACRAIASNALATSSLRRDEDAYVLAHALAALRGRVTLSYAMSGSADGRDASPSQVLLQAWRIARRDAGLSYQDFRDQLGAPASAVPKRNTLPQPTAVLLDARDVWLDAIADEALLMNADTAISGSFPMLDSGFRAMALASESVLTPQHGLVPQAGAVLDPRSHPDIGISPSSLEKIAACPLAWFYKYGLRLYAPEDPAYNADRWLDDKQRGSLLHELFEAFGLEYQGRQTEIGGIAALERLNELTNATIASWSKSVPPPSTMVFDREAAELRSAASAFLQMEISLAEQGEGGQWLEFEYEFGKDERIGEYRLPNGTMVRMKGKVDRVDQLPDGTLRVVDYKTGRVSPYEKKSNTGPFGGGRHLQPALYSAVLTSLRGEEVSRFEYRFPTERGESEIIDYAAQEFAPAPLLIAELLDIVRAGEFVPTNDNGDCKLCDHQAICRVTRHNFAIDSPRASWAKENTANIDAYRAMRIRRGDGDAE